MSAYSDWKCGALSDEEYRADMARECAEDLPPEYPERITDSEAYDILEELQTAFERHDKLCEEDYETFAAAIEIALKPLAADIRKETEARKEKARQAAIWRSRNNGIPAEWVERNPRGVGIPYRSCDYTRSYGCSACGGFLLSSYLDLPAKCYSCGADMTASNEEYKKRGWKNRQG